MSDRFETLLAADDPARLGPGGPGATGAARRRSSSAVGRWAATSPPTWSGRAWAGWCWPTAILSSGTTCPARRCTPRPTRRRACPRRWPPPGACGRSTPWSRSRRTSIDVNADTVEGLIAGADVVLDGADNFEVRYLVNEACVKHGIPWVYGGVLGTYGLSAAILPGETPCLRCLLGPMPPPGAVPTCETAGVLGPAVALVAALEVTEGLKLLLDRRDELLRSLVMVDIWNGDFERAQTQKGQAACPVCDEGRYELLEAERGSTTAVLCGRDAVQVSPRPAPGAEPGGAGCAAGRRRRGVGQRLSAAAGRGGPPAHRLSRRAGHRQGHRRSGPGAGAVRPVHRFVGRIGNSPYRTQTSATPSSSTSFSPRLARLVTGT